MAQSLFLTVFLSLFLLGCSVASPTNVGSTDTPSSNPHPATSTPKPVKALSVTEVWGEYSDFGGIIHFELVPTSKAELGVVCKLEMWSGAKLYETQTITLRSEHFVRGQVIEVDFPVDAQDKIMALIEGVELTKNLVDLKTECLPPPPTPTLIPTSTPAILAPDAIIFKSTRDSSQEMTVSEIYVMNADGSGQTRLTEDGLNTLPGFGVLNSDPSMRP